MAHYINVGDLNEKLTSCQKCFESFDEISHVPRRMPCCFASICHACLEQIFARHGSPLSCPLCRGEHVISSVAYFQKDNHILDTLDFVKIARGVKIPCTDCPDRNTAVQFCEDCRDFLCQVCLAAHGRSRQLKQHVTSSFDDIKSRPAKNLRRRNHHECQEHRNELQFYCIDCSEVICVSCTVFEHKQHQNVPLSEGLAQATGPFNKKIDQFQKNIAIFDKSVSSLKEKLDNLELSSTSSKHDINKMFDTIQCELESRRRELLAAVEEKKKTLASELKKAIATNEAKISAMKSVLENLNEIRKSNDGIEDLMLMSSSSSVLHAMSAQEPNDVSYHRVGVLFSPVYMRQFRKILNASGVVRVVTYAEMYPGTILQDPAEVTPVPKMEVVISRDSVIICPSLEWDSATACKDVTVVGGKVTNVQPDPPVPDSGCRMTSHHTALTTTPCPIGQTDRVLVAGKGDLTVKKLVKNKMLFEVALTPLPVSSRWAQPSGVSVRVQTCSTHKGQLCLWVRYDNNLISDTPVTHFKVGTTLPLNIGILLDRTKCSASIINMDDRCHVVCTIPDVSFARPLWGLVYVDLPDYNDISWELISENSLSRDTVNFLSSLC